MKQARTIVIFLTFITGFAGLVYEVTWHRYLSNLLGSQAQASAIILAVFLGGLSVGYALFGRVSKYGQGAWLVKCCGILEVLIGFWGVLFPKIYGFVWSYAGVASLGFAYDVGTAAVLIGVPTVLMGGTLPLLTQGLSTDVDDSAPIHARLYATNTFGAFAGALVAAFVLLPIIGLGMTVLLMGCLNVIAGLALILLSAKFEGLEPAPASFSEETLDPEQTVPLWRALGISFIAGLVSITLQTVFIRITGLSVGSSEYSFAMVVGVFIFMLSVGAWLTSKPKLRYSLSTNQQLLFVGAVLTYLSIDTWPYGNHVMRALFTDTPPAFYLFYVVVFLAISILLAIPVGAMGSTMPLLFRSVERKPGALGRAVGLLYSVNTLGCVVGALLGGYAALFIIDLDQLFLVCLSFIALSFFLSLPYQGVPAVVTTRRLLTLASMMMLVFILPGWSRERLSYGTFRATAPRAASFKGPTEFYKYFSPHLNVIAYKDDPNTSVAVIESKLNAAEQQTWGVPTSRSLYVNGKSDGVSIGSDLKTTRLVAHIPALLSDFEAPQVAVVGFGLGGTVGAFTLYPEIKNVDVIEIAPAVRSFSILFNQSNHHAGTHEKVRWNMGDAYRVLGSSKERYSIIASEPSNPWVAGVERLYAREFYDIVKSKLTPRGTYAQWFHTYSISEATLGLILNTFQASFPNVRIFAFGGDMLMLGSLAPIGTPQLENLEQRIRRPEIVADLAPFSLAEPLELTALETWIDPAVFKQFGLHSLEFPKLAFAAGRDFYLNASVDPDLVGSTPERAVATRARAAKTLVALSRTAPLTIPEYLQIARSSCGLTNPGFYNQWDRSSPTCKSSLGALFAGGVVAPGIGIAESDRDIVRYLAGQSETSGEVNASLDPILLAERANWLFSRFDSPLFELRPDRFDAITAPCQEQSDRGVSCRLNTRASLASVGRMEAPELMQ